MLEKYNDTLSLKQLCEALGFGKNTAYKLLKENKIKSFKVGKKYFIPKICVIDFINACR